MLISKKSRKKSEMFESRFRDGSAVNFPLRQYLRCREDFTSGLVQLALLVAFLVAVILFGKALTGVFNTHGKDLSPWYRWAALTLLLLFALSVLRRILRKISELRETRQAMARYQEEFRNAEE